MVSMCATGNTERAGRIGQTFGSMVKRLVTDWLGIDRPCCRSILIKTAQPLPTPRWHSDMPAANFLFRACRTNACCNCCCKHVGLLKFYGQYRDFLQRNSIRNISIPKQAIVHPLDGQAYSAWGFRCWCSLCPEYQESSYGSLFTETLAAFMGIMFLGGIVWKRANRYGAGAAVITALSVYYFY